MNIKTDALVKSCVLLKLTDPKVSRQLIKKSKQKSRYLEIINFLI